MIKVEMIGGDTIYIVPENITYIEPAAIPSQTIISFTSGERIVVAIKCTELEQIISHSKFTKEDKPK